MTIGKKIRELRKAKDWTLAELAKHSGVALSSLSRIETGKMTGTLESHILVAKALGVRLAELYADLDPSSPTLEYSPESQNTEKFTSAKGVHFVLLISSTLRKKMLPMLVHLPPGKSSKKEHLPAEVEKFFYLLKGKVELIAGGQKADMSPGDSLYLQASGSYSLKNTGSQPALLLSIAVPPTL